MTLLTRLLGLLLLAGLYLLTSCSVLNQALTWHPPLLPLPDSTRTVIIARNYYAGPYKDRGDHRAQGGGTFVAKANAPVATGASQAQDFGKAGQHGGAVAAAPDASAGATTRPGVPPWLLGTSIVLLVFALLVALAYKVRQKLFRFLPPS